MGLAKILVFLFFLIISTSGIQAEDSGERRPQINGTQTPLYGDDSVIEALTVQDNTVYNTSPNDRSIYGSITKVETDIYDSPDSPQPSSTQTRTVVAPGSPGHQGVTYARSEGHNHEGPPNQSQIPDKRTRINYVSETYSSGNTFDIGPGSENVFGSYINLKDKVYRSKGGENHTQPNGSDNRTLRAITVLTNNHIRASGGMKINMGSSITQEGNVFPFTEQQTDKKVEYITKSQTPSSKNVVNRKAGKPISVPTFQVNLQGKEKAQNNSDSQEHYVEDNASGSQASSPSSSAFGLKSLDLNPKAGKRETAQNNTESEVDSNKPNSANKKINLSFQNLIIYFLIVLPSYYLF